MSLFTLDLRVALFGLLLLPIIGALITYVYMKLSHHHRRATTRANLLASLFAQAPVGLLHLDHAQRLVTANEQARRILGLDSVTLDFPNQAWADLLLDDLRDNQLYRTVELPRENDDVSVVRWWIRSESGGALVLLLDMTNERRAEQIANRLLSDLSHELRTPLATLMTHLEVLSLPAVSPEVTEQSLGFMKDEVQRLTRLSNQTLELGRLQTSVTTEAGPVSLDALAESVAAQMRIEATAKDCHIELQVDDELPAVWGDPDQLRQVLINLLDNAIKYGGEKNRIFLRINRSEQEVVCWVRDSGFGIPDEHIAKLDRRYYRAAPTSAPGSGLGLAMVREILRRHNSRLEISSRVDGPDRGTEMWFALTIIEEKKGV